MARLRPRGNLSCFYCGKRSAIKFDGSVRDFLCLHCDATNYLDEYGDITDPPVAKTAAASSNLPQYAVPRSRSPPTTASPSQGIFCATCLKNQHLFTASLAQYLPEDPDDPDYARREKDYYKFRRHLEQRYPQICAECEPKVLARVSQAGYTAQTDHLRRMMDRSRQQRTTPKQWTLLDAVDGLGKMLWRAALGLQLLWHVAVVMDAGSVSPEPEPLRDPDEKPSRLLGILVALATLLPAAPILIYWSIWVHAASIWWNPRFVQVFRGFSRHILGLPQWYAFQAVAMIVRLAGQSMTDYAAHSRAAASASARISLHGFLAFAMVMFFTRARNSVRVDTTPLFQTTTSSAVSSPQRPLQPQHSTPASARRPEPASMSNLLDDILDGSPQPNSVESIPTRSGPSPPTPSPAFRNASSSQDQTGPTPGSRSLGLNHKSSTPVQYSQEMDWSPTQSKHRAFADFGSPGRREQGFNASPASPDAGPFWYKVPPAPVAPAQRALGKHDTTQRDKAAPIGNQSKFFSAATTKPFLAGGNSKASEANGDSGHKVSFAQPSFFPKSSEQNPADPRNSLADLLSSSFDLSREDNEQGPTPAEENDDGPSTDANPGGATQSANKSQAVIIMNVILSTIVLYVWTHAAATTTPELQLYSRDIMLGCLGLGVAVSAHITGHSVAAFHESKHRTSRKDDRYNVQVGNMVMGICEAVACSVLMWQVWKTQGVREDDIWEAGVREAEELVLPGSVALGVLVLHSVGILVGPRLVR